VKTASSISGNRPFLGPVNFFHDASYPLIAALCFRHSRMLLSSTPKFAAALRFPLSSAHRITSRLNFAVYDSLLDFWRPSFTTRVQKTEKAVCLPVFLQLKLLSNPQVELSNFGRQSRTDSYCFGWETACHIPLSAAIVSIYDHTSARHTAGVNEASFEEC
jgi:hypothetical protein